jgi:thiol-disulfide isomerase/thioredoxin
MDSNQKCMMDGTCGLKQKGGSSENYYAKYLKYKGKYMKLKQLEAKLSGKQMTGGGDDKTLYLFKAEWCGHCKAFKPTWEKLQKLDEFRNKVKFISYDSDRDGEKMKEYNIEGFPTLIMVSGGKAIEFSGPRDEESIKSFINQY